jgi:hypothetical protein
MDTTYRFIFSRSVTSLKRALTENFAFVSKYLSKEATSLRLFLGYNTFKAVLQISMVKGTIVNDINK